MAPTPRSNAIVEAIKAGAADKAADLALNFPLRPTSRDLLRVLIASYIAGAQHAIRLSSKGERS